MSKELLDLLKNTLRMPWDVQTHPQKLDDVISSRLVSECGFSKQFRTPPSGEARLAEAIALPTLITLIKSKASIVTEARIWNGLTIGEKKLIVQHYGLRRQVSTVLHLVPEVPQIGPLASYMGACFAFTVKTVPMFVDYGQIVDAAVAWENKDPSIYKRIEQSGLLVVRGALGKYPGTYKVEGAIFNLLAKRVDCNLTTVFIDVPSDARLANQLARGVEPKVQMVEDMLYSTEAGKGRLGNFLFGMNTYINFNSKAREFNDSRFGLSV